MRIGLKHIAPLLGAAAVSAAIAGAPVAGADPDQTQESCTNPAPSSTGMPIARRC